MANGESNWLREIGFSDSVGNTACATGEKAVQVIQNTMGMFFMVNETGTKLESHNQRHEFPRRILLLSNVCIGRPVSCDGFQCALDRGLRPSSTCLPDDGISRLFSAGGLIRSKLAS
jgi:hypothetical protein